MRLLFLTPQLPYPADKGTRMRNLGLIRELARRHEVGVLSFADERDAASLKALRDICYSVDVAPAPGPRSVASRLLTLATGQPDLVARLASARMQKALDEVVRRDWDVLQVEGLEMAPFWLGASAPLPRVVFDAHNAEWTLQRSAALAGRRPQLVVYSAIQTALLRRMEGRIARSADAVVCVSRQDEAALRRAGRARRTEIVPNAVDSTALLPRATAGDCRTLLFTGTMDYRPNVDAVTWFTRLVLPRIRAAAPEVRFAIVGRSPTDAVRSLVAEPGVEVTGEVADVAPWFERAAAYVAPLRAGGGSRFKLLEAFAQCVPVVSTTQGAEGLTVAPGEHLLVADDPAGLAAAVVELLRNPTRAATLTEAARRLVEARYDWRVVVPRLERLYAEIAA